MLVQGRFSSVLSLTNESIIESLPGLHNILIHWYTLGVYFKALLANPTSQEVLLCLGGNT